MLDRSIQCIVCFNFLEQNVPLKKAGRQMLLPFRPLPTLSPPPTLPNPPPLTPVCSRPLPIRIRLLGCDRPTALTSALLPASSRRHRWGYMVCTRLDRWEGRLYNVSARCDGQMAVSWLLSCTCFKRILSGCVLLLMCSCPVRDISGNPV